MPPTPIKPPTAPTIPVTTTAAVGEGGSDAVIISLDDDDADMTIVDNDTGCKSTDVRVSSQILPLARLSLSSGTYYLAPI